VLQGLVSPYVGLAVVLPLALLASTRLARPATRAMGARLLVTVGVASGLLFLAYAGYVVVHNDDPDLWFRSLYTIQFLTVTDVPWGLFTATQPAGISPIAWATIGLGLLSFTLPGSSRTAQTRRAWMTAIFWVAVGLYISLTPFVSLHGQRFALPRARLPGLYHTLRAPGRLGVSTLVGLSVLSGLAFASCLDRIGPWLAHVRPRVAIVVRLVLLACAVGGMYATYLVRRGGNPSPAAPYVVQPVAHVDSRLLALLAAPGGALLELPVSPEPRSHVDAMYRSIFHHRPILNGYNGYWPAGFPERMALACRLPDPEALAALRRTTGLEMVLVHTRDLAPNRRGVPPYDCPQGSSDPAPASAADWRRLASVGGRPDLRTVTTDGGDILFRVVDAPPRPRGDREYRRLGGQSPATAPIRIP
jgi:hypothetical protein